MGTTSRRRSILLVSPFVFALAFGCGGSTDPIAVGEDTTSARDTRDGSSIPGFDADEVGSDIVPDVGGGDADAGLPDADTADVPGSDTDAADTGTDTADADAADTPDDTDVPDAPEADCGNGIREGDEACDGDDLGESDCESAGFYDGTLRCTLSCRLDVSQCRLDPCLGEECGDPPAPRCEGDEAVASTGEGTCFEGECRYTEDRVDCAGLGQICLDGACAVTALPGQIRITEYMANPVGTDTGEEWFEIVNLTDGPVNLDGVIVHDDSTNRFTVPAGTRIEAGALFVFGTADGAAPERVDLAWGDLGTFQLGNDDDEIVLSIGETTLARVAWDDSAEIPMPDPNGASVALGPDADDPSDPLAWCIGIDDYGLPPNLGSPGVENPPCPSCGDAILDEGEECDDGNVEDGDGCAADCTLEIDPCDGIVCDTPPSATCTLDVLTTYADIGECAEGVCGYTPTDRGCADDGLICREGACVVRIDPGDLVVTEFLADATGSDDGLEWIEIYNASDRTLELEGMVVRDDDSDAITVAAPTAVGAGAYVVLAEELTSAPDRVGYAWGTGANLTIGNTADEIVLEFGGLVIDRVAYDEAAEPVAWEIPGGQSLSLDGGVLAADGNDDPTQWCPGEGDYGIVGATGTPGLANPPCPYCGDGTVDPGEECDDGNNDDGDGCTSVCTSEVDPCEGVTCESPPAAFCDETISNVATLPGECVEGACRYETVVTDCATTGRFCEEGVCVTLLDPGDLVITEFIANPDGTDTGFEWFEVFNAAGHELALGGVVIRDDGTNSFTVSGVTIAADSWFVFGRRAEAAPGRVGFAWETAGSFTLTNDADEIVIMQGTTEIAAVRYDSITGDWSIPNGAALARTPEPASPDASDPANWCVSAGDYGVGVNTGSPGAANVCTD